MFNKFQKPEEKEEPQKSFLRLTWQQVVSAVIVAIFLGILGWMGATVKSGLEKVKELNDWKIATETLLNNDFAHTLENLDEAIQENSSKMGLMSGDIKTLEILVNRLDAIVETMESE